MQTASHHRLLSRHSRAALPRARPAGLAPAAGQHASLFGDGDNIKLRSAIRAHANFAEYVPIIVLLVALLEMSGMPTARVHLLMGVLLLARLLHPLGMYVGPRTMQFQICRVGGISAHLARAARAALRCAGAVLAGAS